MIHNDIPGNWNEILPYVTTDLGEITAHILNAPRCFFYDTCAFRNHMNARNPLPIFEYIKSQHGIVILTRTIVLELCAGNQALWAEHIAYVKKMKESGIIVLAISEEDIFDVLCNCYSGIAQVNQMLFDAIKYTKSKTGMIESVLQKDSTLRKDVLSGRGGKDSTLARRFFVGVRNNRAPGENVGEELLAVCLHMLSNIPGKETYKYIVLTDDYVAIRLLGKVKENVEKYIRKSCISGITTAKLCWLIVQQGLVSDKNIMKEIISAGKRDGKIRIYASEEYELRPCEKKMTVDTFVEKLFGDEKMKVYL